MKLTCSFRFHNLPKIQFESSMFGSSVVHFVRVRTWFVFVLRRIQKLIHRFQKRERHDTITTRVQIALQAKKLRTSQVYFYVFLLIYAFDYLPVFNLSVEFEKEKNE